MTDGENAQHRAYPRIRARLAGVLRGHTAALTRLAFTPDGAHIISTDEKYGLRVWDVGSQTCLRTLSPGSYTFTLSPNGKTVALPVPYEARIQLCDLNGVVQGELVHAHTTPPTFLTGAVFTPDGRFLVTGDMAGQIQVWDVATRRVLTTVAGAPSPTGLQRSAKPLAISRDGRWLTVNADDERGGLQFFALSLPPSTAQGGANAQVAQQVHVQWRATFGRGHRGAFSCVFSPDGRWAAAANDNTGLFLISLADLASPPAPPAQAAAREVSLDAFADKLVDVTQAMAFSPDGRWLAEVTGSKAWIGVWDVAPAQQAPPQLALAWPAHAEYYNARVGGDEVNQVADLAWSPTGQYIATAGTNPVLPPQRDPVTGMLTPPLDEWRRAPTGPDDFTIRLWEIERDPPWPDVTRWEP